MSQKNLMLQQFSERERKRLCQEKDCDDQQLAPDEECVGYLPMIQRGVDYSPYYKTSGLYYKKGYQRYYDFYVQSQYSYNNELSFFR